MVDNPELIGHYGKPLTKAHAEELFRLGDYSWIQFKLQDGTIVHVSRVFRELWLALERIDELERTIEDLEAQHVQIDE